MDGRPWEEIHGRDASNPRTLPQVIHFWGPWCGGTPITFKYRYRQEDGSLQLHPVYYGMDVERLKTGDWKIGELSSWGIAQW